MKSLVLLHGWGMKPSVFARLADALTPAFEVRTLPLPDYDGTAGSPRGGIDAAARAVAAAAPQRCAVLGWSLGAQVALAWARNEPVQVERLVLIGATPSFVRRDGWDAAVDNHVLDEFSEELSRDAARTLSRFVVLQARGDADEREIARALRTHVAKAHPRVLQHGLDLLRETDLRRVLGEIPQETLLIHGERDALTPLEAGEYLARNLPRATLTVFGAASHAPFISRTPAVARTIRDFVQ
jgi:pimeloyl-[acyl-carrier protein] methyl ester esterase